MTPTIIGFGLSTTTVPFAATALIGTVLLGLLVATATVLVVADLRSAS
jgi:hypothetical protein